jgi:hypothetical protein
MAKRTRISRDNNTVIKGDTVADGKSWKTV